ncbi:BglG family transcription antiterminator [Aerococcaceae bacterium WGS1372]
MNERQLAILTLLIKNPGYKIGNLEEELNLSRRQINYSLNQFNSLLEENRIPSIKRNKAGDFFIPSEVVQIVSSNESLEISEIDYMSEGERQEIIILYIIISNHYLSLEHMIDLLKVSKTTMIKDIKNASTYVGRFGLKIEYSRELGYEIIGSERNIRILLNELVILWGERLGNSTLLSEYLIKDETPIIEYINIVEEELGINYSSSSFNLLVKLINYTIARITSNRTSTKEFFIDQVKNTEEYKIVNTTIKNEWINNQSDIEWMTLLFLSSNVYKKTLNIFDESFLRNLVVDMIKEFEIKTLIKIENSNEFIDRLYAHLRPAIYRIRYNLSLERYHLNSLLRDPEHIALLSLVKDLVRPLEEQLNKQFPNEELQLLSLYFGSQYITDEKNKEE